MAGTATVLNFEEYRLHAFQRHGSKLPWFVLAEACEVLGIVNHRDAAERLDDDEKGVANTDTPGGPQQMLAVSLSGLIGLTANSRKPIARRFNKWLRSEVVVTLFLTGEFKGDTSPLDDLVGSFQPLLDLPEVTAKGKLADIIPLKQSVPSVKKSEAKQEQPEDQLFSLPLPSITQKAVWTDCEANVACKAILEPAGKVRPIWLGIMQANLHPEEISRTATQLRVYLSKDEPVLLEVNRGVPSAIVFRAVRRAFGHLPPTAIHQTSVETIEKMFSPSAS